MANHVQPNDELINEAAQRVVYKGLQKLEELLDAGATSVEKMDSVANVVRAGTEAMLPPDSSEADSLA